MNKAVIILLTILVLTACGGRSTKPAVETVDTIPVMVTRIQQCSRLYTAEYMVHKIVTHGDNLQLDASVIHKDLSINIPLGRRRVAIPIDATIKAYIDFEGFTSDNIRRDGRQIEVILPDPRIVLTSTRIDHKAIRQYVGLTRSNFSDEELSAYERQGRQAIIDDIAHMGIIETAQQSAATILVPMLTQMGFSQDSITITIRKHYGIKDIPQLLAPANSERHG